MFSEYASKFLSHSQARISAAGGSFSANPNEAPLFYSAAEFEEDDDEDNDNDNDSTVKPSSKKNNPSKSFIMAEGHLRSGQNSSGRGTPSQTGSSSSRYPNNNNNNTRYPSYHHHLHRNSSDTTPPSSTTSPVGPSTSRYRSSSVYATTTTSSSSSSLNNNPKKGPWGSSFMPKYIMDGGSAVATTSPATTSPSRSLIGTIPSRFKSTFDDEGSSSSSSSSSSTSGIEDNGNMDDEEEENDYDEENNASPAFLSIDDNPQNRFASASMESSISSFDETPQPSLYMGNNGIPSSILHNQTATTPSFSALRRPSSFLPDASGIKNSILNLKNIASSSFLSSSLSPHQMESIQLTPQQIPFSSATPQSKSQLGNTPLQYNDNDPDYDAEDPPDDIAIERPLPSSVLPGVSIPFDPSSFLPRQTDLEAQDDDVMSRFIPPETSTQQQPSQDMPKFDAIWANVYLALISSMLATSLIIWLRTDVPSSAPFKDTMYTMLQKSGRYLFMDIFIASMASVAWIFLLRRYSMALFYLSIVAVPTTLFGFTIYPLIMSYRSAYGGNTTQDRVMRWTTILPLTMGILWCYFIYTGRAALNRALGIIRLASSILADNPPLIVLGYASVGLFILATWLWLHMFMRVFLQGHAVLNHGTTGWVLDPKSWALAAFYIFMYLWSWGVISGFQRSTISAVVSQWYFYRNARPQPSPADMTYVALQYSLSAQFGTICLSSLLRLAVRLPLYILPRRAVGMFQLAVYHFAPTSIMALTNPLALSNAIINSQSLVDSAQAIGSLRYLDHGYNNPTVRSGHSWTAYRLAKMLLSAARGVMSLVLGYSAWVHAAMYTDGSLYGYMAGLIAAFIGWFVLGASEGILSMVVDAAFLCFAIDNAARGGHCTEADRHFGGI
ncbi:uncharacterized protein SAPINGB_P003490 [Magnusiomyces paraingens]|uniref:Uncharacterized protein n=1 Tax=Magnusiomyces paraingens TaxID=2606893 RepID=A0A5E8BPL3_9ASCO|nr:uncharacterized protein SAPINGB_P003490 [Saprochaete ingens]VVT53273.1 unnamed protein product [Saprochaete ingens]